MSLTLWACQTFTVQDGVLRVGADVGVEERTLVLQPTAEASPWEQAERGDAVRGRRRSQVMVENDTLVGDNVNKRLLKRQQGSFVVSHLYKCLCCAESSVLRKYLWRQEHRVMNPLQIWIHHSHRPQTHINTHTVSQSTEMFSSCNRCLLLFSCNRLSCICRNGRSF